MSLSFGWADSRREKGPAMARGSCYKIVEQEMAQSRHREGRCNQVGPKVGTGCEAGVEMGAGVKAEVGAGTNQTAGEAQ